MRNISSLETMSACEMQQIEGGTYFSYRPTPLPVAVVRPVYVTAPAPVAAHAPAPVAAPAPANVSLAQAFSNLKSLSSNPRSNSSYNAIKASVTNSIAFAASQSLPLDWGWGGAQKW